jgi:carbon starvation protein
MGTLIVAVLSAVGFIVAYRTYGRWLGRKIFDLDAKRTPPSRMMEDGADFVPTRRGIVFGHHFTSIAGTGPIVGPAIAVFWGWLPALLWVLIGSIFIGAVHDFGALVVSLRSRGHTIGDVAGRMISTRARLLFLLILFFCLTIVLAIFGLVVAAIFAVYPQTVLPVWIAMPLAIGMGFLIRRSGHGSIALPAIATLVLLYAAVYIGAYYAPVSLGDIPLFAGNEDGFAAGLRSTVVIWTAILLAYCFIASVLPVWLLLQPRDYINSHQLYVALGLLVLGLFIARPEFAAPALNESPPADAPILFPFLFITVACGAVSGFHCLVSSGTSSKQLNNECDAQFVGYGAMLMEGALAVLVILACAAGIGMGVYQFDANLNALTPATNAAGEAIAGREAWLARYGGEWHAMTLALKVGAFVDGGANMMTAIGIPLQLGVSIIAVMVACFAATTLDTATRLQRYVIQEIGGAVRIPALTNKYAATAVAVTTGGALALWPGPQGPGSGGLILWPLFGATNQLLAGMALLVVLFYLARHSKPWWFLAPPLALMIVVPAWAMVLQLRDWYAGGNWLLFGFGLAVELLQVWMIAEGLIMWRKVNGVLPTPLPEHDRPAEAAESA